MTRQACVNWSLACVAARPARRNCPIAIERPSGLVVDALIEDGLHRDSNPSQRRQGDAAALPQPRRQERRLGCVLARRLAAYRWRALPSAAAAVRRHPGLRALVRGRDDLVATRVQLANQLRSLLDAFWPGAATLFAEIDSPIALAFVRRYPTPASAAHCGEKRLAAFLAQHRYSGRRSASRVARAVARRAQTATPAKSKPMPKALWFRRSPPRWSTLVEQIAQLTSRIEHAIAELADGQIIMSLPRAGQRLRGTDPRRAG